MSTWWQDSSMDDANNWDLQAVVRGCTISTASSTPLKEEEEEESAVVVLEELCKPQEEYCHQRRLYSRNPRSKKRKNQQKKVVCQVPAEGLSPDMWAWRKYGQKPIKGSPYPRGYYRCSTSKGCLARKQVERSRIDPTMLVVTYTAEHNHPVPTHRNSLAGTTRNKFPSLNGKSSLSSPQSTLTMKSENYNDDDDDDEDDEGIVTTVGEDVAPMEILDNLGGDHDQLVDDHDDELMKKVLSDIWQNIDGR